MHIISLPPLIDVVCDTCAGLRNVVFPVTRKERPEKSREGKKEEEAAKRMSRARTLPAIASKKTHRPNVAGFSHGCRRVWAPPVDWREGRHPRPAPFAGDRSSRPLARAASQAVPDVACFASPAARRLERGLSAEFSGKLSECGWHRGSRRSGHWAPGTW